LYLIDEFEVHHVSTKRCSRCGYAYSEEEVKEPLPEVAGWREIVKGARRFSRKMVPQEILYMKIQRPPSCPNCGAFLDSWRPSMAAGRKRTRSRKRNPRA